MPIIHLHLSCSFSTSYRFAGTGPCMVANRISYVFDVRGPSMTMDTGCSSALVAVLEGCGTLHAGEAELVLVGGTILMLDPDKLMATSSLQLVLVIVLPAICSALV